MQEEVIKYRVSDSILEKHKIYAMNQLYLVQNEICNIKAIPSITNCTWYFFKEFRTYYFWYVSEMPYFLILPTRWRVFVCFALQPFHALSKVGKTTDIIQSFEL